MLGGHRKPSLENARGGDCSPADSVVKFDFWGKMQKSCVRNSMTYRLSNSRKSNFATEPSGVCCTTSGGVSYPGNRWHCQVVGDDMVTKQQKVLFGGNVCRPDA